MELHWMSLLNACCISTNPSSFFFVCCIYTSLILSVNVCAPNWSTKSLETCDYAKFMSLLIYFLQGLVMLLVSTTILILESPVTRPSQSLAFAAFSIFYLCWNWGFFELRCATFSQNFLSVLFTRQANPLSTSWIFSLNTCLIFWTSHLLFWFTHWLWNIPGTSCTFLEIPLWNISWLWRVCLLTSWTMCDFLDLSRN